MVGYWKKWARKEKVADVGEKLGMCLVISDFYSSAPDLFSVSKDTSR